MVREVVKATGDIITVAGNGKAGYSGDNGPATAAELDGPNTVAVDSAGDLFISDADNNVIREVVKATGDIITIAGNGTAGYKGDNGPATAAEIDSPRGIAVDSAGNVFFADNPNNVDPRGRQGDRRHHHRRRRRQSGLQRRQGACDRRRAEQPQHRRRQLRGRPVHRRREQQRHPGGRKTTGDIITIAGTGKAGYSGDNGPATAAELSGALGVAVDSLGDVFIADTGNNRVREIVAATGDIITVAGTGTAGYSGDNGPATAAELDGPPASPSIPRATCSSPTRATTWSARSRRP